MKCEEITDSLYLGDEEAVRRHPSIGGFDEVITLGCRDGGIPRHSTTGDEFVFVDGEHEYTQFKSAVDFTVRHIERDESVFVHCASGVSRSSGVVTAAITELKEISLENAFDIVKENTEYVDPVAPIRESMERYAGDELDDFRNDLSGW